MSEVNNFKKLSPFTTPPKNIKENVKGSLHKMRFVGSIVDMYLVKPMGLFIGTNAPILKSKETSDHK